MARKTKKYKIYLDVCCLNLPLDDLEQSRIRLEAEAVTEIIQNCQNGVWQLINSEVIEFEISQHSDSFKQEWVTSILSIATIYVKLTDEIDLRTEILIKLGFKYYDALHLAFAEAENADIFLTTDDRLLRKAQQCQNDLLIKVENPIIWLMSILQNKGENHEN